VQHEITNQAQALFGQLGIVVAQPPFETSPFTR
jgi:hypothetical protein